MPGRIDLRPMFKPRSVAVIGASRNPDKVGHIILQNLMKAGYDGRMYPINPNAEEILGLRTYKSVGALKRAGGPRGHSHTRGGGPGGP